MMALASLGVSSRYRVSISAVMVSTTGRTSALLSLAFGLGLKLWIGYLDTDDGGQALAHIIACEVAILFFEHVGLTCIVVEGTGERTAEASDVHTAIDGVDAVGETKTRCRSSYRCIVPPAQLSYRRFREWC